MAEIEAEAVKEKGLTRSGCMAQNEIQKELKIKESYKPNKLKHKPTLVLRPLHPLERKMPSHRSYHPLKLRRMN